jgi:hypothetical protein
MIIGSRCGARTRSAVLIAIASALALLAPLAAEAKPKKPKYSVTAHVKSVEFLKSVCTRDPYVVTETVTVTHDWQMSGSGGVAERGELAKGRQKTTGTRTYHLTRTVQGPNAAPPYDESISEPVSGGFANWSPFTESSAGIKVDLGVPGAEFYSMGELKRKGQSRTFPVERETPTKISADENCQYEERTNVSGTLTVKRTR